MLSRRDFLGSVAASGLVGWASPVDARVMRGGKSWQTLKIGAGGQLSNLDIATDGTMVARPDTYGAYYYDPATPNLGNNSGSVPLGSWKQMVSHSSRPAVTLPFHGTVGSYELRIAPSNTNRFYDYSADGNIWRTDNRGVSWTKTNFANHPAAANEVTKFLGYKMAVDPNNADVVFVGTPNNAMFVTTDAGVSWNSVPTVAASTAKADPNDTQNGGHVVTFVPGTPVGGRTQVIFAGSYGVGVYRSGDGGTSWTFLNTSGMPTSPSKMLIDPNGDLIVTDGHLNKYSGGAWSMLGAGVIDVFASGWGVGWVAIKPTDATKILVGDSGSWFYSTNGGSTWGNRLSGASARTAGDVPWLAHVVPFTVGNVVWGPDNVLHVADGVGHWYFPESDILLGGAFTKPPVTSRSAGIEQLVANWAISPTGKSPIFAFMDRPFFVSANPNVYPSDYAPLYTGVDIREGFSLDWAASDPNFIVGLTNENFNIYGNPFMATSTTAGTTVPWSVVNHPAAINSSDGCVAALSATNWMWVEANAQAGSTLGGHVLYTTDGGATWNASTIAGLGFDNGWYLQNAFNSLRRQMVIADRVNGKYYMVNTGSVAPGIYVSSNNGANYSLGWSGFMDPAGPSNYNLQMRPVPAYSGYTGGTFFITSGTNDDNSIVSNPFWKCVESGGTVTRTAMPGVINVWAFGFGAPKPGGSGVPTIGIYGSVDAAHDVAGVGGYGVWRTDDFTVGAPTWTKLSNLFVNDSLDQVVCLGGDSVIYNRFYVGFNGSGYAYC